MSTWSLHVQEQLSPTEMDPSTGSLDLWPSQVAIVKLQTRAPPSSGDDVSAVASGPGFPESERPSAAASGGVPEELD
jgi:hypothetical protein